MKTDFSLLAADKLLVFPDVAASMVLCAFQTYNCSVDGHAKNDNLIYIYNQRAVKVKDAWLSLIF